MVRYRKPVKRSRHIIDVRNLTPDEARAVIAAHDKARKQSLRESALRGFRRPQDWGREI